MAFTLRLMGTLAGQSQSRQANEKEQRDANRAMAAQVLQQQQWTAQKALATRQQGESERVDTANINRNQQQDAISLRAAGLDPTTLKPPPISWSTPDTQQVNPNNKGKGGAPSPLEMSQFYQRRALAAAAAGNTALASQYADAARTAAQNAYKAAIQTGAELIDCSNRSPFKQALAYIAPFATWRSKMPGAIARTAIRHPERIAIAGRASPELVGDQQQAPNGLSGQVSLPLAEALRGVDDPWSYARASSGYPLRAIATNLGLHGDKISGGYHDYFNYGKPINAAFWADALAGAAPGAQVGLDALGLGQFPDQGVAGFVRGQTGFGLKPPPSGFVRLAKAREDALQAAADKAYAEGDHERAAAIQRVVAASSSAASSATLFARCAGHDETSERASPAPRGRSGKKRDGTRSLLSALLVEVFGRYDGVQLADA
jgi:hypothetical protein